MSWFNSGYVLLCHKEPIQLTSLFGYYGFDSSFLKSIKFYSFDKELNNILDLYKIYYKEFNYIKAYKVKQELINNEIIFFDLIKDITDTALSRLIFE